MCSEGSPRRIFRHTARTRPLIAFSESRSIALRWCSRSNGGTVKRISALSALVLIVAFQATIAPASARSPVTARTGAVVLDTVKTVHVDCPSTDVPGGPTSCYLIPPGIHKKIKHIIIIMQENRSFDSYFGTYPGADGIPMTNGTPTVCNPDRETNTCVPTFHDIYDVNGGGPHGEYFGLYDVNGGAMNELVNSVFGVEPHCKQPDDPACVPGGLANNTPLPDVMGYHTADEIPNYLDICRNDLFSTTICSSPCKRGRCPTTFTRCQGGRPIARTRSRGVATPISSGPTRSNSWTRPWPKSWPPGLRVLTLLGRDLTWPV